MIGAIPTVSTAPTGLQGTAGDGKVSLSWTAPSSDGGQAIASYEIDDSADGTNWTQADLISDGSLSDDVTGLTNGVSYQFRVFANNSVGASDPSNVVTLTPQAATTPPPAKATATLAAPAKATIVAGKSVTVHTTMKADGLPVPNTGVQLQKQVPGSTAWTSAGTAHTNSSGVASLTIKPTRTLTYRWAFLGNTSIAPGVSSTAKIQVAQSVTIALSAHSVTHGKKVKVYGLVAPGAKGQKVTVQRKVGSTWKKIGTATLKVQKLPNGKKTLGYVLTYKPSAKGKQILRATKAKTVSVSAGTSKTVTLKIK
jgi:hypothetical protein